MTHNAPVRLTSRESDDEFNFGQSPPRHRARSSTPPPPTSALRTPTTPHPARFYTTIPETEEEGDGTPTGRVQRRMTRSEREARQANPRRQLIASFSDADGNWTSSLVQPPTTSLVTPAVVVTSASEEELEDEFNERVSRIIDAAFWPGISTRASTTISAPTSSRPAASRAASTTPASTRDSSTTAALGSAAPDEADEEDLFSQIQ